MMKMKIPECCWKVPISLKLENPPKPRKMSPFEVFRFMSLGGLIRTWKMMRKAKKNGKSTISRYITDDGYYQGLSIGGLGAGIIGRTFRGDFARWQLFPGKKRYGPVYANQFSLFIKKNDKKFCNVLFPNSPDGNSLSSWKWNLPEEIGIYYALYPRAWTEYKIPDFNVDIICCQISPFIPHDYNTSCLPCGIYLWEITNNEKTEIEVSILLTWQNGYGSEYHSYGNLLNEYFESEKTVGVKMIFETPEEENSPITMIISTDKNEEPNRKITYHTKFYSDGDGREIWIPFNEKGLLRNIDNKYKSEPGKTIAAALSVNVKLNPKEKIQIPFVIAWDIPIMTFGDGRRWYKRYTNFFGKNGKNAVKIADYAIENYKDWIKKIEKWQDPIINDKSIPNWFKTALFNELYFLADGFTIWEHGEVGKKSLSNDYFGKFAYIECPDYPMYNTYDVHFYASFALAMLFPKIQKSITLDFAETVLKKDDEKRIMIYDGKEALRKPFGVIPHDLGSPGEDPWIKINFYPLHDPSYWKDLNSKFVIQAYRDLLIENDLPFAKKIWSSILEAIKYLEQFDTDNDGLIENTGFPDQTYDAWVMKGVSSYCGGLWITALAAAGKIAEIIKDSEKAHYFNIKLAKAKKNFEEKLWNGSYYLLDTQRKNRNVIMADQLCGHWWAKVCGLNKAFLKDENVNKALETIYNFNVKNFFDGKLGAVNGMLTNGKIDNSGLQSKEVWTGTTYGLAALMLHQDLKKMAFDTAYGIYDMTYNKGYWFRTPEAWDKKGGFRAAQYMRALAIWAMYWALKNKKNC
jgi:non-lysosomal glucosylceramidase